MGLKTLICLPNRQFMFKKLRFPLLILLLLMGGATALYFYIYKSEPYFVKMENVRVTNFTRDGIVLTGKALCNNPNNLEAKLNACDIKVSANGKHVGDVNQRFSTKVPANSDFSVPLTVTFSPRKVFKLTELLGAAFTSLKGKKIFVKYTGKIVVNILGQDLDFPVEYDQDVPLKQEK